MGTNILLFAVVQISQCAQNSARSVTSSIPAKSANLLILHSKEALCEMVLGESSPKRARLDVESAPSSDGSRAPRLWDRPETCWDSRKEPLRVQQLDATYYNDKPLASISAFGAYKEDPGSRVPVVKMFGSTMEGNSVCMHIHGFRPYFYIGIEDKWLSPQECEYFRNTLCSLSELKKTAGDHGVTTDAITGVEITKKQSIWGYQFGKISNFLKIYTAVPNLVASCRRVLTDGIYLEKLGSGKFSFQTYESNLPFVLRFMIDQSIYGAGWVEVPVGSCQVRSKEEKDTHCQIEIDVPYDKIISHVSEGEWLKIAPLRVLSFDIECASRKNTFPEPNHDPVIQIANVLTLQGHDEPLFKNVFTLDTCAPIVGAEVLSFATEADLLSAWQRFLIQIDPDVITGYNIINFDLPYLINRAAHLKVESFPELGRKRGMAVKMKDSRFSSKAYGTRESKDINIEGRVQFDLLPVIQREYKLRSYSLNSVSAHFLQQQKEDVHYSIITDLQNGSAETRRRLAAYCLKDAWLPQRLLDKLMFMINFIEMARVTGVPVSYLLTRGQQIKVISQLYRKANAKGMVIPVLNHTVNEETYEGATVFEPKRGYYTKPISTLDFSSLYPSIMMAHNLCYSTLLDAASVSKLSPDMVTKTPTGHYFVKAKTQKGILPEILLELLQARKRAKHEMKQASDAFTKAVLNGRQLALKISANSVYGFTGANVGQLPCLAISASVTSFGRDMIDETRKLIEAHYNVQNGYPGNATVVYGDTDSVMINFEVNTVEKAIELGKEAASFATRHFLDPINLEFEKVYFPYLLMAKKRYAGLYWTDPVKWSKMDTKGIETVRRDNCPLVKSVIETCLDKILIERNVDDAIDYVKGIISDLLCNRLDISQLVISKGLSKSVDSEEYAAKTAHVELAKRMQKRDPGSAPSTGDRVAYVITRGAKGAKAYEKAEDPIYVLEHDIPIDTSYYLENQLMPPLTRLFEPILGDAKKILSGEHTRSIKVQSSSKGIMKFAVKTKTCVGCKVPLGNSEELVCKHCKPRIGELYLEQAAKLRSHEQLFSQLWTQCQRCQENFHQDVLCSNRDCPIFYRRKKAHKDLLEAESRLEKFSF